MDPFSVFLDLGSQIKNPALLRAGFFYGAIGFTKQL